MRPETTAAAWEVPEPLKYQSPTRAVGFSASTVEPGARMDASDMPGASRSGLPSPEPEHGATVSSARAAVPGTSAAPTVITKGSSPGFETTPGVLPADTT